MNKREFLTVLGSAVLAVPVAMTAAQRSGPSPAAATPADALAQIKARGVLRAGYIPYGPGFQVDLVSGQRRGIFHDVTALLAERLGLKLEWTEEVTFATMFEGFKAGRYDVVSSSIWVNAPRTLQGDFSQPLYYSGVAAYVRAEGVTVGDLPTLNSPSVTIATIDGEMASVIAAQHFPQAKTLGLPNTTSVEQMLINVITRKADVTFVEDDLANRFMQQHPGSLRRLATMLAVPNCIVLPLGQPALKAVIDHNLALLQTEGLLEALLEKYEIVPGTLLRVAKPYADPAVRPLAQPA